MSTQTDHDVLVLGAGTGGMGVAHRCARAGLDVAIVDVLPYGGTCALRGCDPKKMLVGVTEALDQAARFRGNGLIAPDLSVDWAELMAFKRTFTDAMPARVERGLKKAGVTTLHGEAKFLASGKVDINGRELLARYVHIATGARPRTLGVPGEEMLITSTDFLELPALPRRVAFVGGGFISFEFAHIARRAGAEEITVLHRGSRPLEQFDPDLVDLQVEHTRAMDIDVRLDACVTAVERTSDGVRVTCDTPAGTVHVDCDVAVHGAGRVANLGGLDLDRAGIEWSGRGVRVSNALRSVSNTSVFAAGDAADTGAPNLTPVSAYDARIVGKNIIAGEDVAHVDYPLIPSVVFTGPPVARVGLLETEASEQGPDFDVNFARTGTWYSSLRVAEPCSAYKMLVEKGTGRLLGAHLLGPGAEEQVNVLAAAMQTGLTANQIKAILFAYPSYASDVASMV